MDEESMQRLLAEYARTHGAEGIASLLQRHQEQQQQPPQQPQPVMSPLQNFGMSDLHRAETALHAAPAVADPKLLQIRRENRALENLIHNLIASGVVEAPHPAAPRDPLLDQIQAMHSAGQLQQGSGGSPLAAYQGVLGGHAGPSILSGKVISQQQQQQQRPPTADLYYHNQGILPHGLLAAQAQAQPLYQSSPVGSPERKPSFQDSLQQLVSAAAVAQNPISMVTKDVKIPLQGLKPNPTAPETIAKIQPQATSPTLSPADGPAGEARNPSPAAAKTTFPENKDVNKSVQDEDQEEEKEAENGKIREAPKASPTKVVKKRGNPQERIQGKRQRQIEHCKLMRAKRKVPNGRPRVNPVKTVASIPPKPQEDQPLAVEEEALSGLEGSRTRRVRKAVQKFGSIPDDQMYFCGSGGLAYKNKGESDGGAQAAQGGKAPQAHPKRASNTVGSRETKKRIDALVKAAATKPRKPGLSEAEKKKRKEIILISSFLEAAGLDRRGEYLAKKSDAESASGNTLQYQLSVGDLSYLSLLVSEATFHSPKRIVEMCQDLKRWMGASAGVGEVLAEQPLSQVLLKDPRFEAVMDSDRSLMLYLPRRISQMSPGGPSPKDVRVSLHLGDRTSCRKDKLLYKHSVALKQWWCTKAKSPKDVMSVDIGRQIALKQIKPGT